MKEIYYIEAIREALIEEMERDEKVFLMGEDIGVYGGAFGVTKGLLKRFGKERVIDTPMSEAAITGIATGAAIGGMRPVVEIMFMDFITLAIDQILNHAAKFRYISNGQLNVPLVIRTPMGAGRGYGATHSQSLESMLITIPGIKIVAPSSPYDAKGLLKSSIRDNNPVIFLEGKRLYGVKGNVPEGDYTIPLGKAEIKLKGKDITIISYSIGTKLALDSVNELKKEGINPEIIDIRTISPLDTETIFKSIKKTGKAIVIEEGCKTGGVGAEIVSRIAEKKFYSLKYPIRRIASEDLPLPCAPNLENAIIPTREKIIKAIKEMVDEL